MERPDETIFGRGAQKKWMEYAKYLENKLTPKKFEDPFKDEWGKHYPEKTRVTVITNNTFISDKYLYQTGVVKEVTCDMHSFAQGSLYSHKVEFNDLEPQYYSYGQLELAE